jgi:hypothetical protein
MSRCLKWRIATVMVEIALLHLTFFRVYEKKIVHVFVCVHNWNPTTTSNVIWNFVWRVLQSSHVKMEKDLQKALASVVQAEPKKYLGLFTLPGIQWFHNAGKPTVAQRHSRPQCFLSPWTLRKIQICKLKEYTTTSHISCFGNQWVLAVLP